MKKMSITCLAVAALVAGCNQEKNASGQIEKVEAKTQAAAEDMKDYAYAQKPDFLAKMEGDLAAIETDLDALSTQIEKSSDKVKTEAEPKLQMLRNQTARLKDQLEAVRNADESAWGDVKAGFRKGFGELKDGFRDARQWMSEKIAP